MMKSILTVSAKMAFFVVALCGIFAACSGDTKTNEPDELTFRAEKYQIEIGETVKLTVLFNGEDVTGDAQIRNITDNAAVSGGTFTSATAGEYLLTAMYNSLTSETRKITVTGAADDTTVLLADKEYILGDGKEKVTFTVMWNGADVTADATVRNITAGTDLVPTNGAYTFSSTSEGEVEFQATYNEIDSEIVTLEIDEYDPRRFYKKVGFVKFTNYGCPPCPVYDTKYKEAIERFPDRTATMNVHVDFPWMNDPHLFGGWEDYMNYFGVRSNGVPTGAYDNREIVESGETSTAIQNRIANMVRDFPAVNGFRSTISISGSTLVADITVKASFSNSYRLVVGLIEDCIGFQINNGDNYEHDNTLRYLMTPIEGDDLGFIRAGRTVTKEYTVTIPSDVNTDASRLMVYTLHEVDGEIVMGNSAHLPLMTNFEYQYEAE